MKPKQQFNAPLENSLPSVFSDLIKILVPLQFPKMLICPLPPPPSPPLILKYTLQNLLLYWRMREVFEQTCLQII